MKKIWQRRHLWMAWFWMAMAIPAVLWWKESVLFVICLSLYANIESSLGAYNAQKARKENEDS